LGEPESFKVYIVKICLPVFAVANKKKREGKERYTKSQAGYISAIWGADPVGTISTKIGKVVGVHDVIMHSDIGFNIFRLVSNLQGVKILVFPLTLLVIIKQCCHYRAACDIRNCTVR